MNDILELHFVDVKIEAIPFPIIVCNVLSYSHPQLLDDV
jgi:hypothetical protein